MRNRWPENVAQGKLCDAGMVLDLSVLTFPGREDSWPSAAPAHLFHNASVSKHMAFSGPGLLAVQSRNKWPLWASVSPQQG